MTATDNNKGHTGARRERSAAEIMDYMGFPETERGLFVSALRATVERDVAAKGLRLRSRGTMSEDHEEVAREHLAIDWAIERGHSCRREVMDPIFGWNTDVRTMKRTPYFRWRRAPAWVADRFRELAMNLRIFRDRKILCIKNTYERARTTLAAHGGIPG